MGAGEGDAGPGRRFLEIGRVDAKRRRRERECDRRTSVETSKGLDDERRGRDLVELPADLALDDLHAETLANELGVNPAAGNSLRDLVELVVDGGVVRRHRRGSVQPEEPRL